ncbi:cyclin-dependent protein kinase inhibitor SMR3-like [Gastrolobium bilobum]|uniref:cyclin-dependent protein kinase inhibitor SMR3-like n=1 Tax=Gastrolobium bilobum TaxID=150636 RepID=UPI002AB1E581|nr:cyclin-dependent protein kinase inhibitor SMR3-like [Gastrolobium bilobum]
MGIHEKECQTSIQQEQHEIVKQLSVQERDQREDKDHQEEQKQQQNNIIVAVPVAPSSYVGSENYGFKTPTSSDHKIPMILECPGAPRKPATKVMKRKACNPRIVRNLSKEFESRRYW